MTLKLLGGALILLGAAACQVAPVGDGAWDRTYEAAVAASAIRQPSWAVRLRPLPATEVVTVASFTQYAPLDTEHFDVWVSNPAELREKCRGRRDATLALQQVLGLPPRKAQTGHEWHIVLFEVAARRMFRPCPGDPRLEAQVCPVSNQLGEMDDTTARFLLSQFWASRHASAGNDYGLPFTGMGWTYNWDPQATDPVGVSEFVVRRGAAALNARVLSPREFCLANAVPG